MKKVLNKIDDSIIFDAYLESCYLFLSNDVILDSVFEIII